MPEIQIGKVKGMPVYVEKENGILNFTVKSSNDAIKKLQLEDVNKLISGQHLVFNDENTKQLIEQYISKNLPSSNDTELLKNMLGLQEEPKVQTMQPDESTTPNWLQNVKETPQERLEKNNDFVLNLDNFSLPAPDASISFPKPISLMTPPLELSNNERMPTGKQKSGFNWSLLSFRISVTIFIIFVLFIILFGFIGGNKIPLIKDMYSDNGSITTIETTVPVTPETSETITP